MQNFEECDKYIIYYDKLYLKYRLEHVIKYDSSNKRYCNGLSAGCVMEDDILISVNKYDLAKKIIDFIQKYNAPDLEFEARKIIKEIENNLIQTRLKEFDLLITKFKKEYPEEFVY